MLITIQPSDDAFGRFSFAPDSLSFIAAEGSGGSPVSLSVVRDGGSFSTVTVYWAVRMASSQLTTTDILPASGTLEFVEDQRQANFTVLVSDDMVSRQTKASYSCTSIGQAEIHGRARTHTLVELFQCICLKSYF